MQRCGKRVIGRKCAQGTTRKPQRGSSVGAVQNTVTSVSSAACDRVPEHADAVDLDLDDVARLQPNGGLAGHADAGRSAGKDEVARLESEDLRQIGDHLANAKDQLARVRVLHRLAVQAQADAEVLRVGHLVSADQLGPYWRERVERLPGHPLLAWLVELPVARGDVVTDGVAGNVLYRALTAD